MSKHVAAYWSNLKRVHMPPKSHADTVDIIAIARHQFATYQQYKKARAFQIYKNSTIEKLNNPPAVVQSFVLNIFF